MDVPEEVAYGSVRRGVTGVESRDEVLWNDVVVAAFGSTKYGVEDAALKLDAADYECIDVERLERRRELVALPDVEAEFLDHQRPGYRGNKELGAMRAHAA